MTGQHKLSTSSRSVINSGITDDYKHALAEYIWNGFDAGASIVNIGYTQLNELGGLASLVISDNGKGINLDSIEYTFGAFLDSQKRQSFQRTSDVKGKKGKGRFSFKCFATVAKWTTRYIDRETSELKQYTIEIDIRDLSQYRVSDVIVLNPSTNSTGTEVEFFNLENISVDHLTCASFCDFIAQQYAWFLCLNEARSFSVQLNGIAFSYDDVIDCKEEHAIDIQGKHFDVTYIRWNRKISDKFYYYMMNSNLHEEFKVLTSFNNNDINFFHSVYVASSYFNDFEYEENPGNRLDGRPNQSDTIYKQLLKKLKVYLTQKEKDYVSAVAAEKLIASYESSGVFPKFKDTEYDKLRKDDLVRTIKGLYVVQPRIFKGLKTEQKKTFIAFLNLLLDSDEREKILVILEGIVSLTDEERTQLANVLHSTSMSNINKVVNMMHNRLEAVECLKRLVYDLSKFTTERNHIQKIIERCFWLFGEQYHLVSADVTFEKALASYSNYLFDDIVKVEKISIENEEKNRRPDIFLCRKHNVRDVSSASMLEENIIVELKRPSVDIGIDQYRQIEDYLRLIKKEPKFNSESRLWKFIVVSKTIDDDVKGRYDAFKSQNKRYLVYFEERYEIYAMSWDDVFQEFYYNHNYILEKLDFDKAVIQQEIESVRADVDGSNSITQKILALEAM